MNSLSRLLCLAMILLVSLAGTECLADTISPFFTLNGSAHTAPVGTSLGFNLTMLDSNGNPFVGQTAGLVGALGGNWSCANGCVSNAVGVVGFAYTSQLPGHDTVFADCPGCLLGLRSADFAIDWTDPSPTPAETPEPTSLLLLGTGLLAGVKTIRKRKKP